ncbi:MAG: xanthine dehydrogenase family protein subunit M [Acidimicrobiaceae bacterium]|nr:xanthine dehydrogenase family protein subunit M [Acidimicrobiaceae bacterium]
MKPFSYQRPGSLAQTFDLLSEYGSSARILAGGTDLIVGLRQQTVDASVLVDIKGIGEFLPGVALVDGHFVIGATTDISRICEYEKFRATFPALVEAMETVGSVQIRNRATLVGNVCNASPAADTVPPLAIYGAMVNVGGRDGTRLVPVQEFIQGPRQTALRPGEFVLSIQLPVPNAPLGVGFARLTRRRGVDLATVNLSCSIDSVGTVRFAFGAVGPRLVLGVDRSGVLADSGAPAGDRDAALANLIAGTSPRTDIRGTRDYRSAMLLVLGRRILAEAASRLGSGQP